MDPLAHSLVGASLSAAGLRRLSPLATATLVVGANLPDVDAVTYLMDGDLALGVRRGWTHGVLAISAWPLLLAAVMLGVDRVRARRAARRGTRGPRARSPGAHAPDRRARFGPLLLLSTIGVLSHPALDWLNTYGIRLLMPFEGRWFYGDTLFIVDPWLWFLAGAGAALVLARRGALVALAAALALATTLIVVGTGAAGTGPRVVWMVLLVALSAAAVARPSVATATRVAAGCLVVALLYIGLMKLGSERARAIALRQWAAASVAPEETAPMPMPGNPWSREVIGRTRDAYHMLQVGWITGEAAPSGPPIPVNGPSPLTTAALSAPSVRGLATWLRFPAFVVEPTAAGGYAVHISDVRFARPGRGGSGGFSQAVVHLDANLRPLEGSPADGATSRDLRPLAPPHPCAGALAQLRRPDLRPMF